MKLGIAKKRMAEVPAFADGGTVQPFTVRGVMNRAKGLFEPTPAETMTQKYARQDAERAKTPAPVAPAAEKPNVIDTINARNKMMQGLKDGGAVKAGIIRGPGTGTSDSIKGTMQPGSFVMPKDSTDVMVSNGETNFTPEMVQSIGAAALMAAKDLTHTPVAEQKPSNYFDDGGIVEKKKNSFGDAAAASQSSSVSQIPTGGYSPAPVGQKVDSTELGRNVSNAMSALPGVAPVMTGTNVLLNASRFGSMAAATPAAISGVTSPAIAATQPAVTAPQAPQLGISQAGAGRGFVNPTLANSSAPAASIAPTQPAATAMAAPTAFNNKVVRDGNSYSGDNVGGDVSFTNSKGASIGARGISPVVTATSAVPLVETNERIKAYNAIGDSSSGVASSATGRQSYDGFTPMQPVDKNGQIIKTGISPQNEQAAQALSDRYSASARLAAPVAEGGGVNYGDGSGNVGLGFAANLARKNAETGASSIFNTGSRQTARNNLKAMDAQELANTNNQSNQQIAKLNAETQRQGFGIQSQNNLATQQNAAARLGIDRTSAGLRDQQTSQQIGASKQMQDLQARIINAKTPEEKAAAEDALTVITGKQRYEKNNDKRYMKLSSKDGTTGDVAERLFDTETQQYVGEAKKQANAPAPKAGAIVDGYRFKGGNPSDKNNWEKN